jgi:hypothetical protein
METPEEEADAEPGVQSIYAIDCEMARLYVAYAVSVTD